MLTIYYVAWTVAALANSLMDACAMESSHGFWGRNGWTRKYKAPLTAVKRNWYTRLAGVKYQEKFLFSSNLLVFLTDGFHLAQTIMVIAFAVACYSCPGWQWAHLIFIPLIWGFVTHFSLILWRWLL